MGASPHWRADSSPSNTRKTTGFRVFHAPILIPYLLTLCLASSTTSSAEPLPPGTAPTLAFDGTSYTPGRKSAKLARPWQVDAGGLHLSYAAGAPLQPPTGFTGSFFLGAASATITGTGEVGSNSGAPSVADRKGRSVISLIGGMGRNDPSPKNIRMEAFILFPSHAHFDLTSSDAFSAEVSNGFSGAKAVARWVIRDKDGTLHVSEETLAFDQPTFSINLLKTTWRILDVSGPGVKKTGEPLTIPLTGLLGAGIYVEGERTSVLSPGFSNAVGFRLTRFVLNSAPASFATTTPSPWSNLDRRTHFSTVRPKSASVARASGFNETMWMALSSKDGWRLANRTW